MTKEQPTITVKEVERQIDELLDHPMVARCFTHEAYGDDDCKLSLLTVGMMLRMLLNPAGDEMIAQCAAYALLHRYNQLHAKEETVTA